MRKTLLIAAALCLSASAMAQTFEKPLSVSQGNNLYSAPQAGNVYWVFKAAQDSLAKVGNYEGGEHPSVALIKDGADQPTNIGGPVTHEYAGKIYAFEQGTTHSCLQNAAGRAE